MSYYANVIIISLQYSVLNKFVCLMLLKATFNNISIISWGSVLLVKENGGPGKNHRSVESH